MQSTKLIYLDGFNLFTSEAKVLEIVREGDNDTVFLDQTIFYPQGGGQPYDKGSIQGSSGNFFVEEVRFADGMVKHIGKFQSGDFQLGENVRCVVDEVRRTLHSRIHSAGHVVDMAINALKLNWVPGKGYHFPEGPYVEYAGSLEGLDKERLKVDIENLCNKFIKENRETKILFMDKERMKEVCNFVTDYIPKGKPARVVMYGDFGVPCGGTHVAHLSDIRHMVIRKIRAKGKDIRVSYDIERHE